MNVDMSIALTCDKCQKRSKTHTTKMYAGMDGDFHDVLDRLWEFFKYAQDKWDNDGWGEDPEENMPLCPEHYAEIVNAEKKAAEESKMASDKKALEEILKRNPQLRNQI